MSSIKSNSVIRAQSHLRVRDLYDRWNANDPSLIGVYHTLIGHVQGMRVAGGGKMLFIDLTDGTTIRDVKCMVTRVKPGNRDDETDTSPDAKFDDLFTNTYRGVGLELTGTIVKSPERATQLFEMHIESYIIHGPVVTPDQYVLSCKNDVPRDTMRTNYPHLREQTKIGMAISLISQEAYHAWNNSMHSAGMGQVPFVGFTESDCEGGAEQFMVTRLIKPGITIDQIPVKDDGKTVDFKKDFFNRPVFETCSAQLELEYSAMATSGVYTCTRASRAEPSTGPLHLATFDMQEWEAICRKLEEIMAIASICIRDVIKAVLGSTACELEYIINAYSEEPGVKDLVNRLKRYSSENWPIISHYRAVCCMLQDVANGKVTFDELPTHDGDLTKQHERYITEKMFKCIPVFVVGYPSKIKSFYMPETVFDDEDTVTRANCFDLLFPFIGEVVGGSMRESNYEKLMVSLQKRNMDPEPLKHYLDIRKNGSLPHGGAGIGWARMMMVLTGIPNAKDMVSMPRAKNCFV